MSDDKSGQPMEEEVLSDENSVVNSNLKKNKSSKVDKPEESFKETITVTDTEVNKSVNVTQRDKFGI